MEEQISNKILQLVSFKLGEEEFAVDILRVQEINRMTEITRVPRSPDFVMGVINLRGKVIPVIDLRKKMGLPEKEFNKNTRIIVVDIDSKIAGFIVDSVSEVLRIAENTIESAPSIVSDIDSTNIKGVGKVSERLIIILDLEKVLNNKEMDQLENIVD